MNFINFDEGITNSIDSPSGFPCFSDFAEVDKKFSTDIESIDVNLLYVPTEELNICLTQDDTGMRSEKSAISSNLLESTWVDTEPSVSFTSSSVLDGNSQPLTIKLPNNTQISSPDIEFHNYSATNCETSSVIHAGVCDPSSQINSCNESTICYDGSLNNIVIVNDTGENTPTTSHIKSDDQASHSSGLAVAKVPCGKYSWTKKNYCPFCTISVIKLSRHMESKHFDEPEVVKFSKLPKGSSKRRLIQEKLRREGNFNYNKNILDAKKGEVMPQLRKNTGSESLAGDYVPCIHCKGFYKKDYLWKHLKRCPFNANTEFKKRVLVEANLFLNDSPIPQRFKERVIEKMNPDEITNRVIQDDIILKLGEGLFNKLRSRHNVNYISQRMRQTARLLIEVEENNPDISGMSVLLHPVNFDEIQRAINKLAKFDEEIGRYATGALPLKLGHNLRRCTEIMKNTAIRDSDSDKIVIADRFLHLMNTEYLDVSSNALKSLNEKKFNAPKYLPLAKDVKKMTEFINRERTSAYECLLKDNSDVKSYKELAELTLASVLLFNRRRSGEIQRMTLEHFNKGMLATHQCADASDSLGTIEKMLMTNLKRIEILGKKGRGVPVLLRPAHVKHIEALIANRQAVGISAENKYIFSRLSEKSETPLEATKVMRTVSNQANLDCPQLMRSTLLRKHVATMSQLVELAPSELQQLANFMGHDLNVHMDYYRLPDDIEQITKVGRLLIAAEDGKFKRAEHAMNINEIKISEFESTGCSTNEQDGEPRETESEHRQKKRNAMKVRQPWSAGERTNVKLFFSTYINADKLPGKANISKYIEKYKSSRSWKNVKDFVRHLLKEKCKSE